jgi:glycosyltransferase involved in cell wall biosynthesis
MAFGTPVIATRRGSMPEIIRPGENGFLVDTQEQAAAAVGASSSLDRAAVRASVAERFDADRMVDEYLAVYRRVVELHRDREIGIEAVR